MKITEEEYEMPPKDAGRIIRISTAIAKRLEARGKFGQSYNDVIGELIDAIEFKKQ